VYVHLTKANHPEEWDAELLASAQGARDMVAELPGAYHLSDRTTHQRCEQGPQHEPAGAEACRCPHMNLQAEVQSFYHTFFGVTLSEA
jgi:hypothetical protein